MGRQHDDAFNKTASTGSDCLANQGLSGQCYAIEEKCAESYKLYQHGIRSEGDVTACGSLVCEPCETKSQTKGSYHDVAIDREHSEERLWLPDLYPSWSN